MKTCSKIFCALFILTIISCSKETTNDPNPANKEAELLKSISAKTNSKETVDVVVFATNEVIGTSTLHRGKDGLTVNFKASGLAQGTYTLWWVIFNDPGACAGDCDDPDLLDAQAEVMAATGGVVGPNGVGNFSAHLKENDASGSINALFDLPSFGGLHDAQSAEVLMVLRTHGPKIPGMVYEQTHTYNGGCIVPPGTEGYACSDDWGARHRP